MPEICRLSSPETVISIFPREHHQRPHFHASCQGKKISISIADLEILDGFLPNNALRRVLRWAELHKDEIQAAWDAVQSGKRPKKISSQL